MRFYEFNKPEFEYYALIGADNEWEARLYYISNIGMVESDYAKTEEVSEGMVKAKLLSVCENIKQMREARDEFNKMITYGRPYLVLVDGGLM